MLLCLQVSVGQQRPHRYPWRDRILVGISNKALMLDTSIRTIIDPALNRIGAALAAGGVTANGVTWAGFALGLL